MRRLLSKRIEKSGCFFIRSFVLPFGWAIRKHFLRVVSLIPDFHPDALRIIAEILGK